MKILGIDVQSAGQKPDMEPRVISEPTTKAEVRYPTIEVSNSGYNTFDLDLDGMEVGDEVTLVMVAKVKEISERSEKTSKGTQETCSGVLEVTKVGMKCNDTNMDRMDKEEKISKKLDEELSKD